MNFNANSVSYNNIGSFGATSVNNGNSTAMSLIGPSAGPNDIVAQAFGAGNSAISAYNKNSRYLKPYAFGTNEAMIVGDSAGPSPLTFTATQAASQPWGAAAVTLVSQ